MRKLARNRTIIVGASVLGLLVVLGIAERVLERTAAAQSKAAVQAPRFEVDPLWPKPMPNHWVLGQTIGVWVDTDDHVWIVHRSSATLADNEKGIEKKTAELCCAGAPPVLEFDQAGNLLRHWGGPGGLRMARRQPRHRHRLQGERLDWRQRCARFAHPEVHQGREVSPPDREEGRAAQGGRGGRQSGRADAASTTNWSRAFCAS